MSDTIKLILTVNSVIDNLTDAGLPDGDPEINIFTTEGTLAVGARGMKLAFSETEEGNTTTSTLFIKDGGILLMKRGAIESDLTFTEGEETRTIYRIGPYAFDMDIKTKRIRCSLTENGGEVQLIYSMNIGGQEKNVRMKITAKRK